MTDAEAASLLAGGDDAGVEDGTEQRDRGLRGEQEDQDDRPPPVPVVDRGPVKGIERGQQADRREDEQARAEQQPPVVTVAVDDLSDDGPEPQPRGPASLRSLLPRVRTAADYGDRDGLRRRRSVVTGAVEDAAAGAGCEGRAGDRDGAERFVDRVEHVGAELHVGGGDVLVDLLGPAGADDRRGELVAAEHPGERQLDHREPSRVGDRASRWTAGSVCR